MKKRINITLQIYLLLLQILKLPASFFNNANIDSWKRELLKEFQHLDFLALAPARVKVSKVFKIRLGTTTVSKGKRCDMMKYNCEITSKTLFQLFKLFNRLLELREAHFSVAVVVKFCHKISDLKKFCNRNVSLCQSYLSYLKM